MQTLRLLGRQLFNSFIDVIPWWYGSGRKHVAVVLFTQIQQMSARFRLASLGQFLFTPMYGLTDRWSKIISFPVRLVHLLVLAGVTGVYAVILGLVYGVWLLFPLIIVYNIWFHYGA